MIVVSICCSFKKGPPEFYSKKVEVESSLMIDANKPNK